ncbi:MAG: L-seryl-tRNA(Sec) selenium transferase [Alphaproteobacteria bacterium]|nr:L-seryl-tRNA(Sec) selenium transferase [Alphaproteobacteria bacterium]
MMGNSAHARQAALPSVDRVLRLPALKALIEAHGRAEVTDAVRAVLADLRAAIGAEAGAPPPDLGDGAIAARVASAVEARARPSLRPVFNLTGTVLHTNLGRAMLPPEAMDAVTRIAEGASNLEFDVETGRRGDRDSHLEAQVCELTGAGAATVVNNNAAAVLLVLNSLALRKEVPVSRGELIEIGGAFRMPDIMSRAGCKLVEVGTTNRTHARDYEDAVGPRTALIMKVHTSNYVVRGFTASVAESELAEIAQRHDLPFVVDLGAGSLVDLARYGLPHEPTAAETLASGADLVTFSGDKLLGGPQAGIIAGREDLIARIKRNPMKRALRCDKMTIAALAAVLRLHADPDRLAQRLPAIRLLSRPEDEIGEMARRIAPRLEDRLGAVASVEVAPCSSQIGSGSLPVERLASVALTLSPRTGKRGRGRALKRIAAAFRALPIPVIGRIQDDRFILDLRCLTDEEGFCDQLDRLGLAEDGGP